MLVKGSYKIFHKGYRLRRCFIFHFVLFILHFSSTAQQTEKRYLSGTGNDDMVQWDFYCTGGMNAGKWTKIGVPSCWELQGFGKYDYGFTRIVYVVKRAAYIRKPLLCLHPGKKIILIVLKV